MQITAHYYGFCGYQKGLEIQALWVAKMRAPQAPHGHVLGFEHSTCISLGVRSKSHDIYADSPADTSAAPAGVAHRAASSKTPLSPPQPNIKKWPRVQVPRGGGATLHSPGQLVIYPLVQLRTLGLGVRQWVRILLQITQSFLQDMGVSSSIDMQQPGLYTSAGKIAFVGLKITQGISTHGLAINVHNDLKLFQHIQACGQNNLKLDKLAHHTNQNLQLETLFHLWCQHALSSLQVESRSR